MECVVGKQMTSKVTYAAVWNDGFEFDPIITLKMMQFHQVNSSVIWIWIKILTGQRPKWICQSVITIKIFLGNSKTISYSQKFVFFF